jgi:hypothetical protein
MTSFLFTYEMAKKGFYTEGALFDPPFRFPPILISRYE